MKFRIFSAQHQEMTDVAQAIVAHAAMLAADSGDEGQVRPDRHDPLPEMRLALSRQIGGHCAAEIDLLKDHLNRYPQIAADCADLVRRYHDELLAWRGMLMECNASWPARQVKDNPRGFLAVFRPIVEALVERIRWEEQEFYPRVFGRVVAYA